MFGTIFGLLILVLILICVIKSVRVVKEGYACVVETLGKFTGVWQAGLHFKIPFVQRVAATVSLKEQVADFPPQSVITKDNVMITSDSVVYFKIMDARLNTYGVQNYIAAIENLTATTLRSIIGDMTLDESLNSREAINAKMLAILDEATDPWGIRVTRVEIKNITPPVQMQEAMEAQAKAERQKRARILEAEGVKEAAVRQAEGNKEAVVLTAEAEKEKRIREAEGKARAIEAEGEAKAAAIRMLKEAGADEAVLTMRSLEALAAAAQGQSNTIIIPSDLANIAGLTSAIKAVAKQADSDK